MLMRTNTTKKFFLTTGLVLSIFGGNIFAQASQFDVTHYSDYNEFLKMVEDADKLSAEQDMLQQSQEVEMYNGNVRSNTIVNLVETDEQGVYIEEGADPKTSFTYKYSYYSQTSSQKNDKKFKVADLTFENKTEVSQNHVFTMLNSKTTNWTTTGKVSAETQLGNDLIAKTKASLDLSVARSATTNKGTTFTSNITVPAWKTVDCVTWLKGGYSGGTAYYNKYSPTGTLIGQVSYTDQSAWSPAPNEYTVATSQR
ncbi:hypothetical protein CUW_1932 [Turicibacter sanguinis PC909]|uniref:Uncharacterized protein n=1 Tax=Turicibacter sanguinis PC909 TaxID=702450 RepID=A0ABM9ZYU3_9FIRM|nr:hypothetical protein [Turicibacter sanguinis]EFF62526.1 hypothetical protein CUW_1932 [Turicibacter sanguinis PC909]